MSDQGGAPAAGGENGGGEQQGGLYQEALAQVPEELRPYVEGQFKSWDQQVTPKLQEAAQLRKQFEPFSKIDGLTDVPPDELAELVQFRQVLQDPEQLGEWLDQVNAQLGRSGVEGMDQQTWQQLGEANGWTGEPQGDPQSIAQQVMEMLRPELEPVKQFMGSQEQQQAVAQEQQAFEARFSELEQEHGELDEEGRNAVVELAHAFLGGDDPIGKAFERYLAIRGGAQGALIDDKLRQPAGALRAGAQGTERERLSFGDDKLKNAARERFASAR